MAEDDRDLVIVGIGASAGGLEAIREVLASADSRQNIGYVVVQHLDPNHQSMMAELLAPHTSLSVHQASGDEMVEPGHVYVIPPGHGLSIRGGQLELTEFRQPRGLRRPIDDFFDALAEDAQENAVCVILSGTGADGSSGLRAIKENGGLCVVQEPDTARYDGMPVSAVGTGLVDFVRPPEDIVPAIVQFHEQRRRDAAAREGDHTVARHIDDICTALDNVVGHDFGGYKRSTMTRRIQRRMQVLGFTDAGRYLDHIRSSEDECETLFRELLINVTRFFRDADQFEELRRQVIDPLVGESDDEVRVWVPGCSSGEEAYSLAMMFADEVRRQRKSIQVQIFATDIDEQMLSTARAAIYPTASLIDIPEAYRDNYTIGRDASFQIAPLIRDMVRFSQHSVIKDPPFSRLDLISCRNLLIYFGDRLQHQALPIFHYALRPGGYLFLGPSETIGRFDDLFRIRDQKARIFMRTDGPPVYPLELAVAGRATRHRGTERGRIERGPHLPADDTYAMERMLNRYAPASLRITDEGEILRSYGQFARYFSISPARSGPAFAQSLARQGLKEILPTLIGSANKAERRQVVRDVQVISELGTQRVDVIADPLPDDTILLVFLERGAFQPLTADDLDEVDEFDSHEHIVEEELRVTRLRLRSAVEELETANEELKSSNEEMMSMNEELQSTNEELSTVNDELKSKVDELTVANADLRNLLASTELPLIVVDDALRLRNFTDGAGTIFGIGPGDRGRPLQDFLSSIDDVDRMLAQLRASIGDQSVVRDMVDTVDGDHTRHWAMMITPYRDHDGRVDGATLVFADISDALHLESALQAESARLKLALEVARIGIWQFEVESGRTTLDQNARELFGLTAGQANNVTNVLARISEADRPKVEEALRRAIAGEADYEARFRVERGDGQVRYLRGLGRLAEGTRPLQMVGVNFDETSDVEASNMREMMIREMNHRVKNLFSIMAALLRLGARTTQSASELARFLSDRIAALARSHDLSVRNASQPLDLSVLLKLAVAPYEGNATVRIHGPAVEIATTRLTSLALILHEWATNSAKYGALGAADGTLDISWNHSGDNTVRLVWKEAAGRIEARHCEDSGFGTQLVNLSLLQIDGQAQTQTHDGAWQISMRFAPTDDAD